MSWPTVKLGAKVISVESRRPNQAESPFRYVDLSAVDASTKLITSSASVLADEAPSRARQRVSSGDVLVSTVRPNLNGVAMIPPEFDGSIASTGFCVLRPDTNQLDSRYLYHWVRSDSFIGAMTRMATGASYPAVSDTIVKSSSIPLPPLPEQRRIASVLDQVDALRAHRRHLHAQLDATRASAFLKLFGTPNSSHWPVGTIADLLESAKYGTSAKAGPDGMFAVLRMGNLTSNGDLDLGNLKYLDLADRDLRKYMVHKGDVLFNRTNSVDLVGKTALYALDVPMAYAGYLIRLRLRLGQRGEFLATYLNSGYAKSRLRGMAKSIVGMANINAKEIQLMPIPLPSKMAQEHFATLWDQIEQLKTLNRAHLAKLDELSASLQHRAFRGEL